MGKSQSLLKSCPSDSVTKVKWEKQKRSLERFEEFIAKGVLCLYTNQSVC